MITFSPFKHVPIFSGKKSNKTETTLNLTPVSNDIVAFKGKPQYVSQDVYSAMSKYAQNNPKTNAACLIEQVKLICEKGTLSNLEENAQIYAKKVEKDKIKEVSILLNQIKDSTSQPLIKKWMERFNKTLGSRASN